MISEAKVVKLIKIYFFVCDMYEKNLKFHYERFSNNNEPVFTDIEIMTIFLFCIFEEECFKIKQIYNFTVNYLSSFFRSQFLLLDNLLKDFLTVYFKK